MELPQIPELMGLSLLLGLLALMATAAVARGWLRAEEETCGGSAGQWGGGGEGPPRGPRSRLRGGPTCEGAGDRSVSPRVKGASLPGTTCRLAGWSRAVRRPSGKRRPALPLSVAEPRPLPGPCEGPANSQAHC